MISQSSYNSRLKLVFIITSFVILFVSAANASLTTEHNWDTNKFLQVINKERISGKLQYINLNTELSELAELRLEDMIKNNYFAHESPDEKDIDSILKSQNYTYEKRGENLAYGEFVDEADVMNGWMNSKWHRYNIEYSSFNNIGIAHRVVHNYMGGDYVLVVTVFTKEIKNIKDTQMTKEAAIDSTKINRFLFSNILASIKSSKLLSIFNASSAQV